MPQSDIDAPHVPQRLHGLRDRDVAQLIGEHRIHRAFVDDEREDALSESKRAGVLDTLLRLRGSRVATLTSCITQSALSA